MYVFNVRYVLFFVFLCLSVFVSVARVVIVVNSFLSVFFVVIFGDCF